MAYRFEDKFVHFRWSDELKGKKVFYADSIDTLEANVAESANIGVLIGATGENRTPFLVKAEHVEHSVPWKFVYYDPNYEVKVAYEEGKTIQISGDGETWVDWEDDHDPDWDSVFQFRIKPEKYRAFKNTDELKKKWEELCPTNIHRPSLCEPFIWVRCKANNATSVISRFAGTIVSVNFANYNLDELFRNFTFLDGTPCGIEEQLCVS